MKRRNADCGKLRRPLKRNKITESFYGSTFVYVKFLMVWAAVLMADFILEFRFEYLWPFWLLIRSVYDSFKYQGLAFSVFFVCIAVTSDVICYLFIPVQWLFFAASTYVWVQYVWHTDRGICLPTVSLWLLFVYIEASIRLREFKNFPFNLDLCRPFAAHCIGYPVVTLGFGFKSYVSYRFRLRKQKEVQKENEFYYQLLQQALPIEQQNLEKQKALASSTKEESISNAAAATTANGVAAPVQNGAVPHTTPSSATDTVGDNAHTHTTGHHHHSSNSTTSSSSKKSKDTSSSNSKNSNSSNISSDSSSSKKDLRHNKSQQESKQNNKDLHGSSNSTPHIEDIAYIENTLPLHSSSNKKQQNVNDFRSDHHQNDNSTAYENERNSHHQSSNTSSSKVLHKQQNSIGGGKHGKLNTSAKENNTSSTATSGGGSGKKGKNNNATSPTLYSNNKDEVITRLETEVRRHKQDLQGSRSSEQELRSQINGLIVGEKHTKEELSKLREDNENLQNKLHKLVTGRQQDKETVGNLEKQLVEEKKQRAQFEQQLNSEKKAKKEREAAAVTALANANRNECTDKCKLHVRELETDVKQARRETQLREDQIQQLERETQMLRKYKDAQSDNELLMSALAAMQDKNTHLENSLSAENRLKQDLFSALGEAKRTIEIQQGMLQQKDNIITNLKAKMAEVMALIPSPASGFGPIVINGPPHHPPGVVPTSPPTTMEQQQQQQQQTALAAAAAAFSGTYTPPSAGSHSPPHSHGSSVEAYTPPPRSAGTQSPAVVVAPGGGQDQDAASDVLAASSSLNPMANDYTPKMSQ